MKITYSVDVPGDDGGEFLFTACDDGDVVLDFFSPALDSHCVVLPISDAEDLLEALTRAIIDARKAIESQEEGSHV